MPHGKRHRRLAKDLAQRAVELLLHVVLLRPRAEGWSELLVKAQWRHDLINILKDAGRTLAGTGLRANGSVYRDINIGLLLLEAARSLRECQSELEPENPDDVVLKVTVPDRWHMTEAGQRWAAQEAAAPKPMTNGDRIRAMTDEELAESDELLSGLCNVLHGQGYPCEANTCRECLIKWLGSPEKEANDGQ